MNTLEEEEELSDENKKNIDNKQKKNGMIHHSSHQRENDEMALSSSSASIKKNGSADDATTINNDGHSPNRDSSSRQIISQLSNVEWMMILSFGLFKDDLRECLNLFLTNSYMYKITHDFDWFWKYLIFILLEEFQHFSSKKILEENNKKKNTNFGSFIKEIQNCGLLYKKGTHYKQTKHLKKDDNPKLIFLQAWKRVVITGGSNYAPNFNRKQLNLYILKLDTLYQRNSLFYTSSKKEADSVHLFRNYKGIVKSLEISKEQIADNEIKFRAYEVALFNAFRYCNFFTQSSCNTLLVEVEMMFGIFAKTDISYRARMIPLKALIEKRDSFIPIIEIACRFYKLAVMKHLKDADFQQVVMNDFSDILTMLQTNRMYKVDDEHNIAVTILNLILMDPICPSKYLNLTILEHFSNNILNLRLELSNMRCLFDCISEISTQIKTRDKKISITIKEEHSREKCGLISQITNLDEKQHLFDAIVNQDIIYQVSKLDMSKFLSLHYNRFEQTKKLLELCLKQQQFNFDILNSLFDTRIDFEIYSKLISYLLEFDEFHTMKSIPNNLMHTLCAQFYTFLKNLDLIHSKTPFESNLYFDSLLKNFTNLFDFLHSNGFAKDCKDQQVLNEILSNRLQSFLTDNPINTSIPSAIVGRIKFLGVKFSVTPLLDIEKLIKLEHFTPLHILYYSSLSLSTEEANNTWSQAYSHVYSTLINSNNEHSNRSLPKLLEFSLIEEDYDSHKFTLSNFVQELLDCIVLLNFNPSSLITSSLHK